VGGVGGGGCQRKLPAAAAAQFSARWKRGGPGPPPRAPLDLLLLHAQQHQQVAQPRFVAALRAPRARHRVLHAARVREHVLRLALQRGEGGLHGHAVALQLPRHALKRVALALQRRRHGAQLLVLRLQPPRLHVQLVLRLQRAPLPLPGGHAAPAAAQDDAAAAAAAAARRARARRRQRALKLPQLCVALLKGALQLVHLALQRARAVALLVQQEAQLRVFVAQQRSGARHAVQLGQGRHLRRHVLCLWHGAVTLHLGARGRSPARFSFAKAKRLEPA
jgi:hypothetical protein